MDPGRLLKQTIVVTKILQDGPPDAMGDPTETATYSSFRGYVWQTQTSEQTGGGQIETESWELVLHASAAGILAAGDKITENGELVAGELVAGSGESFDVAGPPWNARNPRTGRIEYVHARLVRSK